MLLAMPGVVRHPQALPHYRIVALVLLAHGLLLAAVGGMAPKPAPLASLPPPVAVRMVVMPLPRPLPVRAPLPAMPRRPLAAAVPAARVVAPAPRLLTAAPQAVATAAVVAAPPDTAVAVSAAPQAVPAAEPDSGASFDADYLHNPAPLYSAAARRAGESGRVLLLVRVSAEGEAESVQLQRSSGFARLDEAALVAVRQWRFVPRRHAGLAVAANVVVPVTFRLGRSGG